MRRAQLLIAHHCPNPTVNVVFVMSHCTPTKIYRLPFVRVSVVRNTMSCSYQASSWEGLWSAVHGSCGNIVSTVPTARALWSSCFLSGCYVHMSLKMQLAHDTPAIQRHIIRSDSSPNYAAIIYLRNPEQDQFQNIFRVSVSLSSSRSCISECDGGLIPIWFHRFSCI